MSRKPVDGTRKLQGFAAMDPAKQRALASLGGKAAHAQGRAHEWTVEQARAAGRKGGGARHATPRRRRREAPDA
jgi:uncharacterized protein